MVILQNVLTPPPIERFKRVLWCLSSQQQFGALTVKFSLNPMRPKTRPIWEILSRIFESSFTASSYGAFYVCDNLELIRCNSQLIFKILLIFEILPYASNSSFSASFVVLTITASFQSFWYEILIKRHYEQQDDQFAKHSQTTENHRF